MNKISLIKNTSPKQSGSGLRLKRLRLMAGFTQKALEDQYGISASTLQSWEQEKALLTEKGAIRVLKILFDAGIDCTVEWLLYGTGANPRLIGAEELKNLMAPQDNPTKTNLSNLNDEIAILKEVDIFQAINKDSIVTIIADDGMFPLYTIGDFVGGKKKEKNNYDKFIGQNCIVEIKNNITLVRRLEKSLVPERYTLSCINPNTSAENRVTFDIEITSLAPIIWHRKRDFS